jgi:glycosyltransferase involved in cell wall biosynthesis
LISIIYPYRNRELARIKRSLDSLVSQSNTKFKVIFVDYGSGLDMAISVKQLVEQYDFVEYIYSFHIDQPWSRSKAINIGLRYAETDYVFIADIDIIFHHSFIQRLYELKNEQQNIYFQVGYLSEQESLVIKNFENYLIDSTSIPEGQGLSFIKLDNLIKIGGFDEFFHFWGAEDEDVHNRLQNAGFLSKFYNEEVLLLHQWHKSFDTLLKNKLTVDGRFDDVFNLNKQKLRFNQGNNLLDVNSQQWGKLISEKVYNQLNTTVEPIVLMNKKQVIDNFIEIILPNTHGKIINVVFKEDIYQDTWKFKIKRILGIKTQCYYSLKEVNDLVIKSIMIYYRYHQFTYNVSSDLKRINLKIVK